MLNRMLGSAAIALLALAVAPESARAECGDYVHVYGQLAETAHERPGDDSPAIPCHGPGCRQAPRAPLLPPAPPPTLTPSDWAVLQILTDPPALPRMRALLREAAGHPLHRTDPIFHPPRIAG